VVMNPKALNSEVGNLFASTGKTNHKSEAGLEECAALSSNSKKHVVGLHCVLK
jgi:hypothetical protein